MKWMVMLWMWLVAGCSTAFSSNYRQVFGDSWKAAEKFVDEHHAEWTQTFTLFGVDSRLAEAIVFPELIRYSIWQDQIEQAAVNALYVLQGTAGANFSIGRFQMKPSFAEEVEEAWNKSPLALQYGFVFNTQPNAEARRSRLRRLATTEGQCRYLVLFVRLQQLRHPQLQKLSRKEQVRHLATLYNGSFSASWATVRKEKRAKRFHTDIIPTRRTRYYSYSDIAVAWWKRS